MAAQEAPVSAWMVNDNVTGSGDDERGLSDPALSVAGRFRQALVQRPTSPFLWANLALTKLYLNEVDSELSEALRHVDPVPEPARHEVSRACAPQTLPSCQGE